ncbi:uncharacterized protein LOC120284254 [Drosophila simulans]|uniref:uncharacterized protein LOC120284254 n=1 Tax=Drosophila simulans TaxID=7240 RepID=UPI00192D03D7|nr:uncharacterized protein LOC120284254 [Drosophila simulans]
MAFCGGFFFADFPRFLCPSEDLQISPLSSNCLTWLCVIGATNATAKNSIRDPYAYSTMAGPAPLWAVCPLFTELLTYHHAKAATTVNCGHKDLDRGCLGRLPRLATTATRCKTTKLSYCFLAKIDEPNNFGIPFYWVCVNYLHISLIVFLGCGRGRGQSCGPATGFLWACRPI